MKNNIKYLLGIVLVGVLFFSFGSIANNDAGSGIPIIVHKSDSCGCCGGYIQELKRNGFEVDVKIISEEALSKFKDDYGIPMNVRSCHTSVVKGYFVEGHVPIDSLNELISTSPNIEGIGMAGMPIGSPGMPGTKRSAFEIYSLSEGKVANFMVI